MDEEQEKMIDELFDAVARNDISKVRRCSQNLDVNCTKYNQRSSLYKAAAEGNIDIVDVLIKAGADVNIKDYWRSTSLHKAAEEGHEDVVERLINAGADINIEDQSQETPLHKAAAEGKLKVVGILIAAGADLHMTDIYKETPLHKAAREGHTEVISKLIQAGTDFNAGNGSQSTPLHNAASKGQALATEVLLRAGADLHIRNSSLRTPLLLAVMGGFTKTVNILIQAGADLNVRDKIKKTPLHYVVQRRYNELVEILIYAGANASIRDKSGATPKALADMEIRKIFEDYENALTNVPIEVKHLGKDAACRYASALKGDKAVSNVIKVMLVGHFGVGKTTIAMSLLEKKMKRIDSTDGIDVFINQCLYDTNKCIWHSKGQSDQTLCRLNHFIRIDITDFAGQLIYYTTHQTYLGSRGLFLLVFNLAKGLDGKVDDEDLYPGKNRRRCVIDFLEYWIAMIVTYARGEQINFPKIILIGTHRDQVKDWRKLVAIENAIRERFDELISSSQLIVSKDLFISAKNMSSVTRETIRDIILKEGKKYTEFGKPIPSSWIELQEKLMELKGKNQYFIDMKELRQINSQMATPLVDDHLRVFLLYLHNLGYILYFDSGTLREKIILDPKILIDAMRCFVTCERFVLLTWMKTPFSLMRQSGRVQKQHILEMWKEKGKYGISDHSDHLLAVLKKLDLICEPMIYRDGRKISPDFFLVPCMMNSVIPKDSVVGLNREKGITIRFYSENILPPAIFNRLACSCLAFWEIYNGHFYNGLVVLRSGKFHILEMKRDVKRIYVTLAHTESSQRPDIQWCLAIKLFLTATIEQIIEVYNTALEKPISCDSSDLDSLTQDEVDKGPDAGMEKCPCENYDGCIIEDVNLMRMAQNLRRVDLCQLCAALLNDAEFAYDIEGDYKNFKGDVKTFYVLQEWKRRTHSFSIPELRYLLNDHTDNFNTHIICQAMRDEILKDNVLNTVSCVAKVYDEFLGITAEHVTYKYIHLGLELGIDLAEIERLQVEKDNRILDITRTMLDKWYTSNEDDATIMKLATVFQRCGEMNLKWMEKEFDIEKATLGKDPLPQRQTKSKCILM